MIPNKVKVAGIDYEVREVEELDFDPMHLGDCIYQQSLIRIKQGMSKDKKEQTFVHELLHACFHEAGFDEQDEDTINRVAIVLHQVLKENRLFFGGVSEIKCTVNVDTKEILKSMEKELQRISRCRK